MLKFMMPKRNGSLLTDLFVWYLNIELTDLSAQKYLRQRSIFDRACCNNKMEGSEVEIELFRSWRRRIGKDGEVGVDGDIAGGGSLCCVHRGVHVGR